VKFLSRLPIFLAANDMELILKQKLNLFNDPSPA